MGELDISDLQQDKILAGMASGDITSSLGGYLQSNDELVREISSYDRQDTLGKLSGLLLNPKLQYFSLRIEVLINIVAYTARGLRKANKGILEHWLNDYIGPSSIGMMEDPPEDVHISNVTTKVGNFKILEGTWEGNDFFLQRILSMMETILHNEDVAQLFGTIYSLLRLSDSAISTAGLQRYAFEPMEDHNSVRIGSNGLLNKNSKAVIFTNDDLNSLDIALEQLSPFVVDIDETFETSDLLYSPLTTYPLYREGGYVTLAMPTAVSAAIRSLCIKYILKTYGEKSFEQNLVREYLRFFESITPLGDMGAIKFHPARVNSNYMAGSYKQYDDGRYIGLVFIFDNATNFLTEGWHNSYGNDDDCEEGFDKVIGSLSEQMCAQDDYVRGYILVISCGYGRAQYLSIPRPEKKGVSIESMSAFDFSMLSQSKSISTNSVAKLIDQKEFFEGHGYNFMNPNGFLNLYAYWIGSDKWLLPEEMGFGLQVGSLILPTDAQLELRTDNRRAWDKHCLQIPNEGYWNVMIKEARPLFKEDIQFQVYAPIEMVMSGRLIAACKEGGLLIWIDMGVVTQERELHYHLWDLFVKWISRILPVLPKKATNQSSTLHIKIDISDLDISMEDRQIDAESARKCISYKLLGNTITVKLIKDFLYAFRNETNVAERIIIDYLVSSFCEKFNLNFSDKYYQSILEKVVWSDDARFFHALAARDYLDYAREFKEIEPIKLEEEDSTFSKLGMAWKVVTPEDNIRIVGLHECKGFMVKLTQSIWSEISEILQSLNKRSVIELAMKNMLSCRLERRHWYGTNRSNYALHKDHDDVASVIMKQTNQLTPSSMSSRVIIEMANCVSPVDCGVNCSFFDFSSLIAKVSLLFHYGGVSDAMRTGFIPPLVNINKLGDVLNDLSIIDKVMNPISETFEKEKHQSEAKRYSKYYQTEEINKSVNQHFPNDLIKAMTSEFSATIDDLRAVRDCLQNKAIEDKSDILRLKRSKLYQLLANNELVNEAVVEPILKYFTLLPREQWEIAPTGYADRDWQPWKFRRRLSVLWKPFIQITDEEDPEYIVSVDLFTEAFSYFISSIHEGSFDAQWFSSTPMKKWLGQVRNSDGDLFEKKVEQVMADNGLQSRRGITLNEITQSDMRGVDYGDIDVLGWHPDTNEVFVIECKNFDLAKTYSETCERLFKMRGKIKSNGKPDDLLKHLNRVEQIINHIEDVTALTGIDVPVIRSLVVFNRPAPMCLLKPVTKFNTEFITITQLNELLITLE